LVLIFNLISLLTAFVPHDIQRRFEYKLSFKGPHLVFKDGTIPFWEHSGAAIASNDQVRITPSIRSQKGRIWCKNLVLNKDWEIEATLKISGRGRVGADGMAIWYTDKPGHEGSVFGSNDQWNGLGIFLDSFDNDGQQNNPYISVMTNDGTKSYDHHRDGITQQIGGCLRDFRNKPFPIRIKVEYFKRTLTVYYHGGLNADLANYEICTQIDNIDLPPNGYFGISAETGGLADDHDALSFITHSLIENIAMNGPGQSINEPTSEEQKKYDLEYQEFLKQLDSEKEKYQKEHPEKLAEHLDERIEEESEREFRQILSVQNSIHGSIRSLDSKIAEILGRQERIVSLLLTSNNNNNNQAGGTGGQQQQQPAQVVVDTFRRDEVNHLMNQQNDLVKTIREIYLSVSDVHRKTSLLSDQAALNMNNNNNAQRPNNQQQPQVQANPQDSALIQQVSTDMRNLKLEMTNQVNKLISQQQQQQQQQQVRGCPEVPNCLSTLFFTGIIGAQTVLFLLYFAYKNRSENQLKKFY
jgi:mannose-binding lectin 1